MPLSIEISDADIADVELAFSCIFSDDTRRTVLKCNTTQDIQAGPGSGKTTLLVAKLAILASKWTWRDRGICVLSHTNIARQEVENRLASHPTGHRLLGYPHFIGTIQAFIDQYFSLPYLRSIGIELSRIDDEWFKLRAISMARGNRFVRTLMSSKPRSGPNTVSSLRFEGGGLKLDSADGKVPRDTTQTHIALREIKEELLQRGICRYDDMYAFAEAYIEGCSMIKDSLRFRFPWVFIDEMQDTNAMQDTLLESLFSEGSILQRFGDINQAIFSDSDASQVEVSFPKERYFEIPDSRRFGQQIASCQFSGSLGHPFSQTLYHPGDG